LLREFWRKPRAKAVFAREGETAGFPCVLEREGALPVVWERIGKGEFSMQGLARALNARTVRARGNGRALANINTPAELRRAAGK
jgi:molybdopterin-guanine dinucleotide biosynthesis protein A